MYRQKKSIGFKLLRSAYGFIIGMIFTRLRLNLRTFVLFLSEHRLKVLGSSNYI